MPKTPPDSIIADIGPDPIVEVLPAAPVAPISPTVEIGEWCLSHVGRHDFSLLGGFEATMKSRNKYVATVAEWDALFIAFGSELAP